MKVYLLKIEMTRSSGDGEHEFKKITRLVYAESFDDAVRRLEIKFSTWSFNDVENLTIE